MQITDILAQTGGFQSVAQALGVSEDQVSSGAAALLPALLEGFQRHAPPAGAASGNEVLGQVFGSRDVSRAVAQDAAQQTGLDPALLRKMLPLLAMLVSGFMARPGGEAAAPAAAAAPGLGALLDMNGDGNALDDVLRLAGRVLR